jgi:hypothetical protein
MGSLAALALTLTLAVAPQERAVPETLADLISAPSIDGKPVDVAIGFYIIDFARVTSREESFDATGYLELSWHDSRVAPPTPAEPALVRRLDAARIWTPRIFFENALEQPRYHDAAIVESDARGLITSWTIISCKFSAPMDLHRFPFDRQRLTVRIGSFQDESTVRFAVKPELVEVGEDAFLTDWSIVSASAKVDSRCYVRGQEKYGRYVYGVDVRRRWTFYVWRVMLPLTLLTMVSWAAFWFEPVGLQPQISTCMGSLIALVAFNFAIDFSLPKVTYLTIIDKHALIGIVFVVVAVAVVTCVHLAVDRQQIGRARSIQRLARWTLLPAYAVAAALCVTALA